MELLEFKDRFLRMLGTDKGKNKTDKDAEDPSKGH